VSTWVHLVCDDCKVKTPPLGVGPRSLWIGNDEVAINVEAFLFDHGDGIYERESHHLRFVPEYDLESEDYRTVTFEANNDENAEDYGKWIDRYQKD